MRSFSRRCILLGVLALLATGCASDDPVAPPGTDDAAGTVTSVGLPNGTIATSTIGPAGGQLASADGKLILSIPAGALTTDVNISIQPITNNAPLAFGVAYRLSPDGQHFALPVTLTYSYSSAEIEGTVGGSIGLAYHGADRVWRAVGGVEHDSQDSSVSGTISHFSDWAWFCAFAMRSEDTPILELSGTYTAKLLMQPAIARLDTLALGEVRLAAASASTSPVQIVIGTGGGGGGAGSGSASQSSGSVTYTAPATIPPNIWMILTITWPIGYHWGTVTVDNFVWIGGVIEFTLDGQHYSLEVLPPMSYSHDGRTAISGGTRPGVQPMRFIAIAFGLDDVGTHKMINTGAGAGDDGFSIMITDRQWYPYYYECVGGEYENRLTDLGRVTIDQMDRQRHFFRGSFTGKLAVMNEERILCGSFEQNTWTVHTIVGTFCSMWGEI